MYEDENVNKIKLLTDDKVSTEWCCSLGYKNDSLTVILTYTLIELIESSIYAKYLLYIQ